MKTKNENEIVRCSSTSLDFSNTDKLVKLNDFIQEYKRVVSTTVDYLWNLEKIPSLLPNEMTTTLSKNSWLSARAIQSACKQASGIVRGTRTKQKKRLAMIKKFNKEKMFKKARKLQKLYDKVKMSKPKIENVCPELDERFVAMDFSNDTSFDGWITLTSLGNKLKLVLPVKKTEHFNKMMKSGKIKKGIRISPHQITFNFTIEKPVLKTKGKVIGADIGIKDVCTLSSGTQFKPDIHGHTLETIQKELARKSKGSKSFLRAQKHRTNYIRWHLNQIDFDDIRTLRIEDIKNLRKGKRTNRYMSHWTYTEIKGKLEDLTLRAGVQLVKTSPTYTSQRCSKCGWTRKKNRNGKKFVCTGCGNTCDADHNASVNISLDLPEISQEERLLHNNRKGFYWNGIGQEPIVSGVQKILTME